MRHKLAILGGSSQVASSVAMYLDEFSNLEVTAFVRSTYAGIFYKRLGIQYQLFSENNETFKTQLMGFDTVIDFTIPHSEFWENRDILKKHISHVMEALPKKSKYILISSQNAFGFKESDIFIKNKIMGWSSPYCSLKRFGEKYGRKLGKKFDIQVFSLRLGQVHGFLQSVSSKFSNDIASTRAINIYGVGSDLVNTLFIGDLAESIVNITSGIIEDGTYSVLSKPQWTQEQIYDFYKSWNGSESTKIYFTGHKSRKNIYTFFKEAIINLAEKNRGFIDVVILQNMSILAFKAKGYHRINSFKYVSKSNNDKVLCNLLGSPPMEIIGDPIGTPNEVFRKEKLLEKKWLSLINSTVISKN